MLATAETTWGQVTLYGGPRVFSSAGEVSLTTGAEVQGGGTLDFSHRIVTGGSIKLSCNPPSGGDPLTATSQVVDVLRRTQTFFQAVAPEPCPRGNTPHGGALGTVALNSGEFVLSQTDLAMPGRGVSLNFTRTYRSQISYCGPLGHGWTHNYDVRLVLAGAGHAYLYEGDGNLSAYIYDPASDSFFSPQGTYARLVRNGPLSFTLIGRSGTRTDFGPPNGHYQAYLVPRFVTDTNGNKLTFAYGLYDRLASVTDPLDNKLGGDGGHILTTRMPPYRV